MKLKSHCSLLLLLLLALPLPASALCLFCTCSASATGVSFGTYNPFSDSDVTASGNVRISCSGAIGIVDYHIDLNRGIYSASFSPRQMGNGANRLNYNLYTSNSYGTIWGDGTGGTGIISNSLSVLLGGSSRDHTVYGLIPEEQTTTMVGSYSDTITVTITYE